MNLSRKTISKDFLVKHPLVYIEWADAFSPGGSWKNQSDIEGLMRDGEWTTFDVGFLMRETKDCVVLASRVGTCQSPDDVQVGSVIKIPRGWCRIHRLSLPKEVL